MTKGNGQMVEAIRADSIEREPVDYLWAERIPRGMISLVAGMPGQGKSLFGYYQAALASQSAGVIYSTWEESLRKTAVARLEAAGARLDRIKFWNPELPEDLDKLYERIVRDRVELVVLDPIAAHLSVSINNDQEVRRALSPLTRVAEETDAAILLVSHTIKRPAVGAHPMDAIGGAGGGLRAAARIAFIFGPNPHDKDERLLACVKTNIGPEPASFAFEIDTREFDDVGEVAHLAERGERGESLADARIMIDLTRKEHLQPNAKLSAASDFLIGYLRLGPRPVAELKEDAKQYGHSNTTLRRAADQLGVIKPAGGRNSTWALPDGLLAELAGDGTGDSGDE